MTAQNAPDAVRDRLTGAVTVVVGARGGMGARIVAKPLAEGATVVAADLQDVDASDPASLGTLLDDVARCHGRIDVLVHAAGMVSNADFAERTTEDVEAELAVNLASPMHLVRMALPLLKKGRLHECGESAEAAVIGKRTAEVFPNRVDGWLARAAMLAPGLLPHVLPRLEPLGRRGMARYREELIRRGDLPLT